MPRPKSFVRHFFGLLGWLAAGATALALIMGMIGQSGFRNAQRLEVEGAEAPALVTDKRISTDSDGDRSHFVRYEFTVGSDTFEDRQDVSAGFYRSLQEGDTVPVRYWTGDPTLSEIEPGAAASVGLIGSIIAAAFAILALIFGRLDWKRAAHATWMARHGVRRLVTIIDHKATNVSINEVPQWRATWHEADGREGETRMAPREDLPAAGSQIWILVDPDHRHASVWEKDVLA